MKNYAGLIKIAHVCFLGFIIFNPMKMVSYLLFLFCGWREQVCQTGEFQKGGDKQGISSKKCGPSPRSNIYSDIKSERKGGRTEKVIEKVICAWKK